MHAECTGNSRKPLTSQHLAVYSPASLAQINKQRGSLSLLRKETHTVLDFIFYSRALVRWSQPWIGVRAADAST